MKLHGQSTKELRGYAPSWIIDRGIFMCHAATHLEWQGIMQLSQTINQSLLCSANFLGKRNFSYPLSELNSEPTVIFVKQCTITLKFF